MKDKKIYKNPDITVWELTLKCNLKCLHCGSSAGFKRTNELTTKQALQLCHDLSDLGFKGIALMGGELFLRKDWEVISKEIKDLGIILSIITNGYFSPDKIIRQLNSIEPECVMVGLDGSSAEIQDKIRNVDGAFNKIMNFIHAAKEANLPIGIITTVHKMNFADLPNIKNIIVNKQIGWQIQEATPIGRFPKNLLLSDEEYYTLGLFIYSMQKKYKTKEIPIVGVHNFGFFSRAIPNLSSYPKWEGCYAGKTVLGIQSNGNVKGCLALSDKFIEGNVLNRKIQEIWNDLDSFSYNRNFKIENLGENCRNCKYGKKCKGGCLTRSSSITGIPHNDPNCYYRIEKNIDNLIDIEQENSNL
ncbi:MAG: radical SAM protein [Thermoplasmatales archaeon]|nr:MAG: radical SAM protein [Thermoplasmatales archaeon]